MNNDLWDRHEELAEKYWALLPHEDLTLTVLRGHLMVERFLWEILLEACPKKERLEKARISFPLLHALAEALTPARVPNGVWMGITELNQLRNALAHNLEPTDIEQKVNDLFHASIREASKNGIEIPEQLAFRAALAIASVIGRLALVAPLAQLDPEDGLARLTARIEELGRRSDISTTLT